MKPIDRLGVFDLLAPALGLSSDVVDARRKELGAEVETEPPPPPPPVEEPSAAAKAKQLREAEKAKDAALDAEIADVKKRLDLYGEGFEAGRRSR